MSPLYSVIVLTLFAGLAMPVGALIAHFEKIRPIWLENELMHGVTAFGAGALLSAIALVLVPEGIVHFSTWSAAVLFLSGGIAFMWLDIYLSKNQTSVSQLVAMLSDFIPESLALGAAFALGSVDAVLLAMLIAMQNLPEGFNAFRELKASSPYHPWKIILWFLILALCGPVSGVVAYLWLSEWPSVVSGVMLFASGGILYAVFQDIAPRVALEKHWAPPMGAVMGFSLGLIGYMLTQ
ncbi:divalent cation transporter [Marinomonas sp. M1K-6]|uniref:Divalent cation transporter n=1 Tax=Marinomonas profundi TaxID=2726122 RepID=A0A847RCS9_9GAMM|nr:divalent cation transporter [Marinomonas profundi]NLQ18834.1 divalent cation transporter [Marinomonas profundi]UDV02960.1 divalent cation transporter [Marinomonas profundi]